MFGKGDGHDVGDATSRIPVSRMEMRFRPSRTSASSVHHGWKEPYFHLDNTISYDQMVGRGPNNPCSSAPGDGSSELPGALNLYM